MCSHIVITSQTPCSGLLLSPLSINICRSFLHTTYSPLPACQYHHLNHYARDICRYIYIYITFIADSMVHRHSITQNNYTRAVLRLECSLDCISGSVGHQQNIFILSLSALLLKYKKCNYKKCNWVSGSPSILYKLVLSHVPILHTNFQENLLMSYSWCPQLSR